MIKKSTPRFWNLLLSVFAFSLPFGPAIPNLIMALIGVFWIWHLFRGEVRFTAKVIAEIALFSAPFLINLLSMLWTTDLREGLDTLSLQVILWAFAIVILTDGVQQDSSFKWHVIQCFVLGVSALLTLSLIAAFINFTGSDRNAFPFQNKLSEAFLDFHYLSMSLYVACALVFLFYLMIFRRGRRWKLMEKLDKYLLVFLFVGLLLLMSRTTILMTILVIGTLGMMRFRALVRTLKTHPLLWLGLVLMTLGIVFSNPFREKVEEAVNYENKYEVDHYWGGRGFRALIWKCAVHNIRVAPLAGSGVGDQQEVMDLCYQEYRYRQLLLKGNTFNTHNQYLQHAVSAGIIGLLVLFGYFFLPLVMAWSKRDFLLMSFVLLIAGCALTESLMQRNAPISLIAFFYPFLYRFTQTNEDTSGT